jgi:hypothetical protein
MKATLVIDFEFPGQRTVDPGELLDKVERTIAPTLAAMLHANYGPHTWAMRLVRESADRCYVLRLDKRCRGLYVGPHNTPVTREEAKRFTQEEAKAFCEAMEGNDYGWSFQILHEGEMA